jgi:GntR family transcriptional regulator
VYQFFEAMPSPLPQPLPKHLQISEALIREIRAGRLGDGERLPPERILASSYGVAVGTLRKALAELTRQRLLERRQGSGNYIRHREGAIGIYGFFRLERLGGGGVPTAEVLSAESRAEEHRVRRLRRLDGEAVAVEEIVVARAVIPRLDAARHESLYLAYRREHGIEIARAEDRIGLGVMPGWAPELAGGPCALVERRAWDAAGRQVENSFTWFDSGKARYVNRMI